MQKTRLNLKIFLISWVIISMNLSFSQVLPSDTASSKIELKAWADKLKMGFDEDLIFTVQAVWDGELDRFKTAPIRPPECKLLEILGSSSVNETKIIEGKSKTFKTFNFILKPNKQGHGEIGAVTFGYIEPITQDTSWLSTQSIAIEIGPPLRKGGGDAVIYLVLFLVIFFTSMTYFVIRKREKKSKKEEIKTEQEVEKSLEEETLEKLFSLESLLSSERVEEFFSEAYRLITKYLESKYHIITSGKTSSEIMVSLSRLNIQEKRLELLESILKRCDLVKFAREKVERDDGEKVLENFKIILEQS